jgi:uncharacterized protein YjiS (DUF1127 family)
VPAVDPQEHDARIARLKRLDSTQLMLRARILRAHLLRRYITDAIKAVAPLWSRFATRMATRRALRELATYDERLLRDMGLTRYDVAMFGRSCSHALPERPQRSLGQVLQEWARRARQRRMLARFNERDLQDIALSRCDAEFEIGKPRWRR